MTHGDYEHSDARTSPLWIGALVLAALIAGSLAVSHWIERGFTAELEAAQTTNPIAELRSTPATPVLQSIPSAELVRQRAAEEALLHAPASWIDPLNGIVRIPIDEAMQKVLVEGLPVRAEERR